MTRRKVAAFAGVTAGLAVFLLFRNQPERPAVPEPAKAPPKSNAAPVRPAQSSGPSLAPQKLPPASGAVEWKSGGPDAGPAAPAAAAGNPALFGKLVSLGQSFSLAEALSKNAAAAERHLEKLCEETRKLRSKPALHDSPSRDRDAAEFMAPLIDYEKPLDDPPGLLHLPEELNKRVAGYGSDWPLRIDERDFGSLDFTWMAQLRQFDHWTVLAFGRLRDVPADNIMRDPIPNYLSLLLWSKLRLAMALRRGDAAAASSDVRHLADLIRSQDILIAEMIAIALYRIDAHARTFADAAGTGLAGWPAGDPEQFDRHRRAAFASIYFTYPGVDPDVVRKAIDCAPTPCVALVEGAAANRAFGAYGGIDNFALVRELAAAHGCEAPVFDRVSTSREISAADALEASEGMEGQIEKFLDPQKPPR
jgi:hypothetical protein